MTRVNCSVSSCSYWGQGEVCNADSIWVKNNMATRRSGNIASSQYVEFADDLQPSMGANASEQAHGSDGTCCETMKPKDQGQSAGTNRSSDMNRQQESKHVHGPGCGCQGK